jgi:hypothetical protein
MLSVVSAMVWPSVHVEIEVVALVPSKTVSASDRSTDVAGEIVALGE